MHLPRRCLSLRAREARNKIDSAAPAWLPGSDTPTQFPTSTYSCRSDRSLLFFWHFLKDLIVVHLVPTWRLVYRGWTHLVF